MPIVFPFHCASQRVHHCFIECPFLNRRGEKRLSGPGDKPICKWCEAHMPRAAEAKAESKKDAKKEGKKEDKKEGKAEGKEADSQ